MYSNYNLSDSTKTRKYIDDIIESWKTDESVSYLDNYEESDKLLSNIVDHEQDNTSEIRANLENIDNQIVVYETEADQLKKMTSMRRKLMKENAELKATIDRNKRDINTNSRKVVYEEWARERLNTIGKALKILYLLIIGLYLYYGPFIKNQQWKTMTGWFMVIILVIFPFIVYRISIGLRAIYDKTMWFMDNKSSKNVYIQ